MGPQSVQAGAGPATIGEAATDRGQPVLPTRRVGTQVLQQKNKLFGGLLLQRHVALNHVER